MSITEIALIKINPGFSSEDTTLRLKLAHAKKVMHEFTGHSFHWMQQTEDPSLIYVIGEWDSLEQHMNEFIPSSENQALLDGLKHEVEVEWLIHLDVPQGELPFPKTDSERERAVKGEIIYSITRHVIKDKERAIFETTFDHSSSYLREHITEGEFGHGFRIDRNDGPEECILISPWRAIDQHVKFGVTDAFTKFSAILHHVEEVDIKHMKLIDV